MKYISLVDELGLDLEALTNIDSSKIIRLQKQLKANAVLNNTSNLGELSLLIEHFKEESTRKNHLFVEKHIWLKQIISGLYTEIPQQSIFIDGTYIRDIENLKSFLSPYLKENIKPFLSETLNKGKYELLVNVVKNHFLFSEEVIQIIVNFFKSKLDYACVYLNEDKILEKHYPVAYIRNYNFIKSLNQFPNSFSEEIQELCSEVVDLYNSKRRNISNEHFVFAAKTMVALGKLDVSNLPLKDLLESNADIARPYTSRVPKREKSTSGSGFSAWGVIVVIIIILKIASYSYRSSRSNSYDINNNKDFQEIIQRSYGEEGKTIKEIIEDNQSKTGPIIEDVPETTIENEEDKYKVFPSYPDKLKSENHIRFIYTLKRKTQRKTSTAGIVPALIKPFSNPYPKTFYTIPSFHTNDGYYRTQINNKSNQDLVVFRLIKGVDESLYIPKDEKTFIDLKIGDSIVFYVGKDFIVTRFSHFKHNTDLSKMYAVEGLENGIRKTIDILPFYDKINSRKSGITGKKVSDTIRKESIKTKNVKLNTLSIDKLYTEFYNKNYRN